MRPLETPSVIVCFHHSPTGRRFYSLILQAPSAAAHLFDADLIGQQSHRLVRQSITHFLMKLSQALITVMSWYLQPYFMQESGSNNCGVHCAINIRYMVSQSFNRINSLDQRQQLFSTVKYMRLQHCWISLSSFWKQPWSISRLLCCVSAGAHAYFILHCCKSRERKRCAHDSCIISCRRFGWGRQTSVFFLLRYSACQPLVHPALVHRFVQGQVKMYLEEISSMECGNYVQNQVRIFITSAFYLFLGDINPVFVCVQSVK